MSARGRTARVLARDLARDLRPLARITRYGHLLRPSLPFSSTSTPFSDRFPSPTLQLQLEEAREAPLVHPDRPWAGMDTLALVPVPVPVRARTRCRKSRVGTAFQGEGLRSSPGEACPCSEACPYPGAGAFPEAHHGEACLGPEVQP